MIRAVPDHEFIRGVGGELALLLDAVSEDVPQEPVFLVSRDENKGYLRRSPGDVREMAGISPKLIDEIRRAGNVVFLEVRGPDVVHGYDAPASLLEDEQVLEERIGNKEV
jgi:hypothetical protein